MKVDFHIHTDLSPDSEMTIELAVASAKKAGLSAIAVTNHNVSTPSFNSDGIHIIPSCEFSTDIGHLLVFFLNEDIENKLKKDASGYFSWREVTETAHLLGALVFLAHPFAPEKNRPCELFDEIDGIEVFNSRSYHSRNRNANQKALNLCKHFGLSYCAGSDAHSEKEVGTSFMEFDISDETLLADGVETALKNALLAGNGRVRCGHADIFDVLLCKRSYFRRKKLYPELFKNTLWLIYAFFRKPFVSSDTPFHIVP